MKTLCCFLMLLLSPLASSAEDAAATPESIANNFFATLMKGDAAKAVDAFFSLNPNFGAQAPQLQMLRTQLQGALQVYGTPSGVESIQTEELAPSLQRRVYMTNHATHPLVWEMYFYKSKSGWLPDQIQFRDTYELLGPKK
jgi:hypothetical protein